METLLEYFGGGVIEVNRHSLPLGEILASQISVVFYAAILLEFVHRVKKIGKHKVVPGMVIGIQRKLVHICALVQIIPFGTYPFKT